MQIGLPIVLLSGAAVDAWAKPASDFPAFWAQDNDRCLAKRSSNVTLPIELHDPELTLETFISHESTNSRRAIQKYTSDGRPSVSTGADGDGFDRAVTPEGLSLLFSIEEHERGSILRSTERWSVIENGADLGRISKRTHEKQILFHGRPQRASKYLTYRRVQAAALGWQ